MKYAIYRKWNFLSLWNKFVIGGNLIFNRKVFFIQFDTSLFYFWEYTQWVNFVILKKVFFKLKSRKDGWVV